MLSLIHIFPIVTALAIVRTYADENLVEIMKKRSMSVNKDKDIIGRWAAKYTCAFFDVRGKNEYTTR